MRLCGLLRKIYKYDVQLSCSCGILIVLVAAKVSTEYSADCVGFGKKMVAQVWCRL